MLSPFTKNKACLNSQTSAINSVNNMINNKLGFI